MPAGRVPEEQIVVVAEDVWVRREGLQVLVGGHRRVGERDVSSISRRRAFALDFPQKEQEQRWHRQLNQLPRERERSINCDRADRTRDNKVKYEHRR